MKNHHEPVRFSPTKWVSAGDSDWAETIGIFVYPKGFSREGGNSILRPELAKRLDVEIPEGVELTVQDVALGVLKAIVTTMPNLRLDEIVRAYAVVSAFIGMQNYPHLSRPFAPPETN